MFRIAHPEYLYLYLALPVFVLLFLLFMRWKRKSMKKFGEVQVVGKLFRDASKTKPVIKFVFLMLSFISLVFALAQPQLGTRLEEVKRKGVDVVIALDVSNSMNAEDIRPSRLERSKQAIYRMIDQLQGDRIGLIVFAGQAYVQLPITTDYGAAKLFLSSVNTGMVPSQGTAIGSAIRMGMTSIGDSSGTNSSIIVITDGENHEDDAIEAAREASKKGIVVHTIGMGSAEGAPIPVIRGNNRSGYLQDQSGTTVITKLDEALLQQIADAGKGKYVRASNSDDGIALVLQEIDRMEKKEFATKLFTSYEDQFQYFLGLSLLFLLLDYLVSERKSAFFNRLNLFGENKNE